MQRKPNPIFPGLPQPAWLTHSRGESEIRVSRSLLVAIGLSLLVHAVLLLIVVRQHLLDQAASKPVEPGPLVVSIAKPSAPHVEAPPPVLPEPPPEPKPRQIQKPKPQPKPQPVVQPKVPPTMTAKSDPLPKAIPLPATPPAPPPPKAQELDPSQFADMAAYLKAKREQRTGVQEEDKDEDLKKANLKQPKSGTNGVFQVPRMDAHTAILIFRGWKGEFSYSRSETFEVNAGMGEDIQLAIVRKMIEIIRRYYDGDFNWDSPRKGRVVVLSARLKDNDELEDFLMKEFFIHGIQY